MALKNSSKKLKIGLLGLTFVLIFTASYILPVPFLGSEIAVKIVPLLDSADSKSQCIVVSKGCHGKRYAINKDYSSLYNILNNPSSQCTLELRPLDMPNYSTTVENGRCQLEASTTNSCNRTINQCKAQQNVVEKYYQ